MVKVLFILASRSQKGGPFKKVVRPQIVQQTHQMQPQQSAQPTEHLSGGADPVTTAAVAASAAVAATQPFLQVHFLFMSCS